MFQIPTGDDLVDFIKDFTGSTNTVSSNKVTTITAGTGNVSWI